MANRPDDIPEWAWEKAEKALGAPNVYAGPLSHQLLHDRFARAILAAAEEENEACALVALRFEDGIDAAEHIRRRIRQRKGA